MLGRKVAKNLLVGHMRDIKIKENKYHWQVVLED